MEAAVKSAQGRGVEISDFCSLRQTENGFHRWRWGLKWERQKLCLQWGSNIRRDAPSQSAAYPIQGRAGTRSALHSSFNLSSRNISAARTEAQRVNGLPRQAAINQRILAMQLFSATYDHGRSFCIDWRVVFEGTGRSLVCRHGGCLSLSVCLTGDQHPRQTPLPLLSPFYRVKRCQWENENVSSPSLQSLQAEQLLPKTQTSFSCSVPLNPCRKRRSDAFLLAKLQRNIV